MAKIIVSQGMCSPIRPQVMTALKPYGFNPLHVEAYAQSDDGQRAKDGAVLIGNDRPLCNVAEITVSDAAARWCEYVLLRSHKFQLMTPPLDPRNERWAAKWGTLPRAWTQTGCSAQAAQPATRQSRQSQTQRTRRTRQQQDGGGILGTLARWLK